MGADPSAAFATGTSWVQIVAHPRAAGTLTATSGGATAAVGVGPGPASVVLDGLAADRAHSVSVEVPGRGTQIVRATTLPRPPGEVRCRIATLSDLHLGTRSFGARGSIHERPRRVDGGPLRCARAAMAEAEAWGADLIVLKGDLTSAGKLIQWRQVGAALHDSSVPVVALAGNHDTCGERTIDPRDGADSVGLDLVEGLRAIDLPGIRVVLASTTVEGRSRGRLGARAEQIVAAAAEGPAALVVLHHQLELRPDPPLWPPGITRAEADRFLEDLAHAQPASLVTSGHTHRHRRRAHGPVTITQVGSTKDFPGVWAGYEVYDGGIVQTVRRIGTADQSCLAWTDATARAFAGLWPAMSSGSLDTRCFTLAWPTR